MRDFKIINLKLKNFKGIKDFTLNADGSNLNIEGGNATGKTTIFDSFTWLLFGKDSLNRTKFEIKTLNEDGEVAQHGLDHEVEGSFSIDGKPLKLKRVMTENWTKKRGESQKKFTGHTNRYYVNDEPVKKGNFDDVVSEIVSEEAFRLLTNPLYFNEHLSTKERRETLIEIAGDVSIEDIIKGNEELEKLVDKLEGRTVDGHRKMVNEKRKELNKELDMIPVRIDEINLSLPDVKGLKRDILEEQQKNYDDEIKKFQDEINDLRSGAGVNNKRKDLSDIELKIAELRNNHGREVNEKISKLQLSIQENESNVKLLQGTIDNEKAQIDSNKIHMKRLDDYVESLRDKFREVRAEEFEYVEDDTCPTCKQNLPVEQVEEAREKATENFNLEKAKELESIKDEAEREKKRSDEYKESINKAKSKIEKYEKEIDVANGKVERLKKDLEKATENVENIEENKDYQKLVQQKESIEKEIETLKSSVDESVSKIQEKIVEVEDKKKVVQSNLNSLDMFDSAKVRLKELEAQEEDINKQLEDLDHQLYLADEFDKKKVNLLESKINSKFKYARFRLFEKQINGGYNDVCQTLYEGVPYDGGLNNAARINVGLDIINTLAKHYGLNAPIFVDNAESIIDLIEIEAQTIGLVVKDKPSIEVKKVDSEVA